MPLNDNYICSSPEIPQYAPTPPPEDGCGCDCDDVPFYQPPQGEGKPVEILAGDGITVDNLSDVSTYRFRITAVSYEALTLAITNFIPYSSGVSALLNGYALFGKTVDRVDMAWDYNKNIFSQVITTNVPAYTPPVLAAADRAISLTGLTITVDRNITLTANDGSGKPGGIQSDFRTVRFGNFVKWGKGTDKAGALANTLQALFDTIANSVNTITRARSFYGSGLTNEYEFYFVPARFGEVTFKKGIFVGGFIRLKNVNGTLVQTLQSGDTELPIILSNGFGSEAYYVYESMYDAQNDPTEPIIAY